MRTLFLPLFLAIGLYAAEATIVKVRSHVFIGVGQQFVLGGDQRGAFRISAFNSGLVPVSLGERRTDGSVRECGRLEPGKSARLNFAAGAAVLMRNLGPKPAELKVEIKGATTDVMKYEPEAAK